jgi:copper(I)-binding protein
MPGLRRHAFGGRASRYPALSRLPARTMAHLPARTMARLPARTTAACAVLAFGAALLAGCGGAPQPPGPELSLLSAQVTSPNSGVTDAYVIVQNKGPAVRLIGARSSAGGTVQLRSPAGSAPIVMHTVPAILIPAHSLFRLDPSGSHLLITGSGPMQAGREITLTLIFANAGAISVAAMVTNPATGGSSYFLN